MALTAGSLAEDLKNMQGQIHQLQERLDFISPMLPLVNFVQDFFQKVECEASLQLMRLRTAQVLSEDEVSNAQLETVKWLHFVTAALLAARSGAPSGPARPLTNVSFSGGATGTPAGGAGNAAVGAEAPWAALLGSGPEARSAPRGTAASVSNDSSPTAAHARGGGYPGGAAAGAGGPSPTPSSRWSQPPHSSLAPQTPQPPRGGSPGLSEAEPRKGSVGFLLQASEVGTVRRPAGIGGAGAPPQGPSGDARWRDPREAREAGAPFEPAAEPGTGGTAGPPAAPPGEAGAGPGGVDSLVLGRGSWAAAYRQAQGRRRDALRLLCSSGIVTARELSDDLTVISEDHIDECVSIATEMLQTWTLEMWARQPQEAKKFFEARLTAMYQRKFGEQKG